MTTSAKRYTDHVRSYARTQYIEPARRRGEKKVRIVSGDIYRALKVPNVVPSVCNALKSKKFLKENGLALDNIQGPPSGKSTTVVFEYRLVEKPETETARDLDLKAFYALRGLFKKEFEAVGGGEAWLRNERAHFYKPGDPRADPETGN